MPSGATGGQQRKQGVWRAHEVPAGRVPGAIAVPGRHVPVGTLFSSLSSLNSTLLATAAIRRFPPPPMAAGSPRRQQALARRWQSLSSRDLPPCGTHAVTLHAHTHQAWYFMLLPAYAVSYLVAAASPPPLVYVLCLHEAHDFSRCRRRRRIIFGAHDSPSRSGAVGSSAFGLP